MSLLNTVLLWLSVLSCCEAYKILVIFPMPARSHANLGDGVVRHLVKAGHEVTYISPFPYKPASPSVRYVDVSGNFKALPWDVLKFESIMKREVDFSDQNLFMNMMINIANHTIHGNNVQNLLNDPKQEFDVVIAEWMFTNVLSGFSAVYNCPLIWVSSVDIHWMMMRLIDQSTNPAYNADINSVNFPPFTFWQRVTELYTQIKGHYLIYMVFNGIETVLYEQSLVPIIEKRGRQAPAYNDVQYNASLVLANSHVSLGQAVSIPHNYIPVGGFHVDEDVKPLPEDLKKIMDNAKHGVIYFSMGSNLKSKDIPKSMKDNLLKMFSELKQTVLWKFEEDLPNAPKNVHILNWAPQQSILAHPNVIVFITHGGLLSTTETVHFGKPIIAIPVFGDQFINAGRAVRMGFALKVDLTYNIADDLKVAVNEVIGNSRYAQKVKELSFVYHDRPVSPGKQISHWVRHVIETRGAPLLRSPAFYVPFYQKAYLDLLALILAILTGVVVLVKRVCNAYCSSKNVPKKKKTN